VATQTAAAQTALLAREAPTPTLTPTSIPIAIAESVAKTVPAATVTVPAGPVKHVIKQGDTLIQIASVYNTTVKDISDANGLNPGGVLRIGQELLIPVAGPSGGPGPTATSEGGALMYVVKAGDTLLTIADRYDSRLDWIMQANQIVPGEVLHIGRALLVPLSASTPSPTPTPESTPTPTPTSGPRLHAPGLLAPADGGVISGSDSVLLTWAAPGTLAIDEWYVVTVKVVEADQPIPPYWTRATSWRLPAEYRIDSQAPTEFTWQVQVRQGKPEQPGDAVSALSAQRRFAWK
jgi:LysM repeat protein